MKELKIYSDDSDKYSTFRTRHIFRHVADVHSIDEFREVRLYANQKNIPLYILGNGSNTFFERKIIKTLVIRNCLKPSIEQVSDDVFDISSSVKVSKMLRFLLKENRSGPYNLASVPAQVGGAIAMNAGTGRREGMYLDKYIISVTFLNEEGVVETLPREMLSFDYRQSIFLGRPNCMILSGRFCFPHAHFTQSPIRERLEWAKINQELSIPSVGSVWKTYDGKILKFVSLFFRGRKTWFSGKSLVWICNRSKRPQTMRIIILFVKYLHKALGKRCELETRVVK